MSAKRHKVKVVVVSGNALPAKHTYVSCALIDTAVNKVWKRYQAKTPLGEGANPTWKKSLVFGGMPQGLAFALRFDVFNAENKDLLGRVQISKEDSLSAIAAYKSAQGTPQTSWSTWYPLKDSQSEQQRKGFLHVALVPPSVKTAEANLSPPIPAPSLKKETERKTNPIFGSTSVGSTPKAPEKPEKPWTEERLTKAKRKRIPARQEIIDSEASYLNSLSALMETYVNPMGSVVSADEHKKMFTDVKSIYSFHQIFFPFMQKSSDIGSCFLKYADYLKIYTEYINHYADVIECLSELRKNRNFINFLRTARKNAKV
mmetsp:Transcript_18872/g.26282  ORF Transcript_18872/g.26282 Transcript_18872/m.26282 type:complete len:316 (-) Transcript_18872:201-1148(-)